MINFLAGSRIWLFAGSDTGGELSAVLYSLIGMDPEAWLRYVICHIQDWPVNQIRELLPWKVGINFV